MMIDLSTIRSLELIQNIQNTKSNDCLFGIMNHTLTPMGQRLLRSSILQPSTQGEEVLIPRYDALEELTSKEEMFFATRQGIFHHFRVNSEETQFYRSQKLPRCGQASHECMVS